MINPINTVLNEELNYFEIEQALGRYPDIHRLSKYGRNLSITQTSAYQKRYKISSDYKQPNGSMLCELYVLLNSD